MADDPFIYYLRLSSAGYGSVNEIEEWDARKVLQALAYEKFKSDYEDAYMEMLKNDGG